MNAFDLASKLMRGIFNAFVSNDLPQIRRDTTICISGNLKESMELIKKNLNSLQIKINDKKEEKKNENENVLKCFFQTEGIILTFSIEINPTSGKWSFVEVRRGKGDILKFNKFFRDFVQALGKNAFSKSQIEIDSKN
eukprot:EC821551.1.p1 GENE.EC821551.1~~EC821551.1.p1  ORF type:complete len:138 (+),score=67.11 EC821551.1:80-493(+)